MPQGARLLFGTLLILASAHVTADAECLYCGEWKLTGSSLGADPPKGGMVTVTEHQLALPYCRPLPIDLVSVSSESKTYVPPESATISPAVAVYTSRGRLKCNRQFGQPTGPVTLEIELRPRGIQNGEELKISIYSGLHAAAVVHAGEIIEYLPTQPGQMQQVRRRQGPTPFLEWWLIRSNHNPCEEGTNHGEALCRRLL